MAITTATLGTGEPRTPVTEHTDPSYITITGWLSARAYSRGCSRGYAAGVQRTRLTREIVLATAATGSRARGDPRPRGVLGAVGMSGDDNEQRQPIVGGVKWTELQAPWPEHCHKHRTAEDGKRLTYVGWRTIQGRLDACCGPFGWGVQVFVDAQHGVVTATITIHDGQRTITRSDAAGIEGVPLAKGWEDSVKIGVTEACKRAAGQFGIGRELYMEPVEGQPAATGVSVAAVAASKRQPISPTRWPRRKASSTIMRRRRWTRRRLRQHPNGCPRQR